MENINYQKEFNKIQLNDNINKNCLNFYTDFGIQMTNLIMNSESKKLNYTVNTKDFIKYYMKHCKNNMNKIN